VTRGAVRVLLSARDPGGAAQVREVAPALRADGRFAPTVAASGPALDLLAAAGERPERFVLPDGTAHVAAGGDPGALLDAAAALVERAAPDVIVTGISSLGVGLDEALLARAGGRPTFALQDYPGDANAVAGAYAGTYFVRDEPAAALTRARFGVAAVPVGSLRHAAYARVDVAALREATRRRLGAAPGRPVVGFFGQPAEIPGHETAFAHLVQALGGRAPSPLVVLREHPKAGALRDRHLAMLGEAGLAAHDASEGGVEPWLAACDLVATCFSHCTMDFAFLSAMSETPLGAVLFVMTTPECRAFVRDYAGLDVPDGAERGLGRIATAPGEVGALVDLCLSEAGRRAYHAVARTLPRRVAFDVIADRIAAAARAAPPGRAGAAARGRA
jgi:hypothetical protein